ncbi:putative sugar nucleotidyl transferase [Sphingobacterium psychroaquaticum]|uniref:UDP-N-acetylglucosamine diphosphorylase/glucosamine-1-phosphate N-acetyltransferase n=1 Tax=Sphingobacterium psychroaquaticum TaxID=561061 RepID=A0A1X7JMK0_9SPHI|nr:putative sugar nucleotidyl transferase [Sphingobacterium psychroaquaticum]SMG29450.1 UDP-N-acetylglucosamine diphosphorylase/glucosamine-1-phosphate N-acetyltransferase [Sphingobacterium psychroaquaticum]
MMEVVLHDRATWRDHLLPLSYTRPVGNLRVGALTLQEKWCLIFDKPVFYHTETYLQDKFKAPDYDATSSFLVIRGNICPSVALIEVLRSLPVGTLLVKDDLWIAYHTQSWNDGHQLKHLKLVQYEDIVDVVAFPEDIFLLNAAQIVFDYNLLTDGKQSAGLSGTNVVLGTDLFIGEGVEAECCTFNTTTGPILIEDGAKIEEGSHLRGPIAIGKSARVKMGTKLYPNVTIGPGSVIGGEVNNTVLWGNSAKGHDGYLGCAVLGEGCNLGGGTGNSNMQNNWKTVSLFDYKNSAYRDTGQRKVGLFMGDYAMCGINSTLTTGCVIGTGAQLAISNIIPKFVPDFLWLTDYKSEGYDWVKFEEMLAHRMIVRGDAADETTLKILWEVFVRTKNRNEEFIKQRK